MPPTILIIEDDSGLRTLSEKSLQREGYQTAAVATGQEALDWLASHRADLLLLDFRLPDMTGEQLVDTLEQQGRRCPFIIVTGFGDERLAVTMLKKGALDYLIKDQALLELLPVVVGQALEQLRQNSQLARVERELLRFREVMDQAGEAILIANAQTGQLIEVNETAVVQLGYTRAALLDLTLADLEVQQPLKTPAQWRAYLDQLHALDGQCHIQQSEHRRPDGFTFPMEQSVFLKRVDDHDSLLVLMRDISERQKAAEQQIQLERLEALQQLSGGIRHNLNNILVAVLAPAELIKEKLTDPDDLDNMALLIQSTHRAINLIKRLAESVKGQEKAVEAVALKDAIEIAIDTWPDQAAVQVDIRLAETPPCRATYTGLHTILLTLIENAVDAMPQGGTLTIGSESTAAGAQIILSDTGVGMDEEHCRHLFEPFHTDKATVGAGLGLASAHGMIKHWGGEISFESVLDKGTTVRIDLEAAGIA